MKVVKIDKEVPEVSAKTTEQHAVAEVLGKRDKEDPHALVELLVCDTEELNGCLAHLDDLALWDGQDCKTLLCDLSFIVIDYDYQKHSSWLGQSLQTFVPGKFSVTPKFSSFMSSFSRTSFHFPGPNVFLMYSDMLERMSPYMMRLLSPCS